MKKFIRTIFPEVFFEKPEYFRALMLAIVYLLLFMLQLFSFEKFYPIVANFNLPGGVATAVILTGLLPLIELLSLPYLLSMRMRKRAWEFSRIMTLTTPSLWLLVALWLAFSGNGLTEMGIFGATVVTYFGWWVILFFAMLLISAGIVYSELTRRHT